MGVSNSALVAYTEEDPPWSYMEYIQRTMFAVHRLYSLRKRCGDEKESNEEQNPLAVIKLALNSQNLLEKLKNWLKKQFPCVYILNIGPSIYRELIYKSPQDCQKMVVAGYRVCLQLKNCSPLYYDGSKYWMLIWDDSVPPPSQSNTGSRSWSIVFMEVAVDRIDLGGPSADNRNPKVYLKFSLNVAYDNMTWPPTDYYPFDVHLRKDSYMHNNVLSPYLWNPYGEYTLKPQKLNQLFKSIMLQKYEFLIEQPKVIMPNFKVNIAEDLNSAKTSNEVLKPYPYYKPDSNLKHSEYFSGIDPEPCEYYSSKINNDHQDVKYQPSSTHKSDLHKIFPEVQNGVQRPLFINNTKYGNHQDLNNKGRTKRFPPALICIPGYKVGSLVQAGFPLLLVFAMFQPASALSQQGTLVHFEIVYHSNNHLNCTLKTDNGCDMYYPDLNKDTVQHQKFNISPELETFCEERKKKMELNLMSIKRRFNLSSDTLQIIVSLELDEHLTTKYICDGRVLTNDEIAHLPVPIFYVPEQHEFNKTIDPDAAQLREKFREMLLLCLQRGNTPVPSSITETTTKSTLSTEVTTSKPGTGNVLTIIAPIAILLVIIIACLVIYIKYGKKICKQADQAIGKVIYSKADQGEDNVEEAQEQDYVAIHVPIPPNPKHQLCAFFK